MTSISTLPSASIRNDTFASDKSGLKNAAQSFEAVLLRQILESSRKAKLSDDLFGSNASDTYRELQDANLADYIASRGAFGIAAMVEKQFSAKGQSHD